MLFNSLAFLVFFPLVTLFYFLLPHKYRWVLLLLASCVFYAFFIPAYLLILFFIIMVDYLAAIWIERSVTRKRKLLFLILSLITNGGVLAFFKYYNFFNENLTNLLGYAGTENPIPYLNIILPIGLSFHTFQAMSYTIEVYRGNQPAEKHLGIYALYVMFYPQLVAGPIERPQNLLHQFREKYFFDYDRVANGLKQMLWGFFKKIVIADRLSVFVDQIYGNPGNYDGLTMLLATYAFAFQIYCDFSGYSDIAIGAARVMGFKLMENFRVPYLSASIAEFWSRWHISLSTWFRDYLYIPLGGNRVVKWRWYYNLFIVFLVSGLWHGANWTYIVWGAVHGAYLVLAILTEDFRKKMLAMIRIPESNLCIRSFNVIFTFHLVLFAWIFFRSANMHDAQIVISKLASLPFTFNWSDTLHHLDQLDKGGLALSFLLLAGFIFSDHFMDRLVKNRSEFRLPNMGLIVFALVLACILVFGYFGDVQFIYFQF